MKDNLSLVWYRFKYAILAAGLLLPALGGFLLSRAPVDTGGPAAGTDRISGELQVLTEQESGLVKCFTSNPRYNEDRKTCLAGLGGAWPVAVGAQGLLLPDGSWFTAEKKSPSSIPGDLGVVLSFAEGDLDNDGFPETLIAREGNSKFPFQVYSKTRGGDLTDTTERRLGQIAAPVRAADIALVDINRDGWLDIITRTERVGIKASVKLYNNRGWQEPGTFDEVENPWAKKITEALGAIPPGSVGLGVTALRVVDMDRDGYQDMLAVSYNGVLVVLWGKDGGFEEAYTTLPVPVGVVDLEVGDINRDDRNDVLLGVDVRSSGGLTDGVCPFNRPCDRGRGLSTGGVLTLLGENRREFAAEQRYHIDGVDYLTSLELVDIDSDGWEEIFLGRETPIGDPEALQSDGLLLYSPAVSADGPTGFDRIDVGRDIPAVRYIGSSDIDNDADLDIILSGRTEKGLLYWENRSEQMQSLRIQVSGSATLDRVGSNPVGIGALVEVVYGTRTIRREIGGGGRGENQTSAMVIGLGTGPSTVDKVTVYFPATNTKMERVAVPVGTELVLVEP
jgi:hypothetical protein